MDRVNTYVTCWTWWIICCLLLGFTTTHFDTAMDTELPIGKSGRFDYSLCIICQTEKDETISPKSRIQFLEKVVTFAKDRSSYGDSEYAALRDRLQYETPKTLSDNSAFYHQSCYKSLVHPTTLQRTKERYESENSNIGASAAKSRKRGRPSADTAVSADERCTRSKETPLDKSLCIFCQCMSPEYLHEITTHNMGQKIMKVVANHDDASMKVRIGSILQHPKDAVAYDMKYHLCCWVKVQRRSEKLESERTSHTDTSIGKTIADIEIIQIVENALHESTPSVLNMNDINTTYLNVLNENGISTRTDDYKRQLKALITESISDVNFVKSVRRNEPERLCTCSTETNEKAIDIVIDSVDNAADMKVLSKAASILRREVSETGKWTFNGSFDNYEPPRRLYTLLKWLIVGNNRTIQTEQKVTEINKSVSAVAQHVVTAFKTDRQVRYIPPHGAFGAFSHTRQTPLSVGMSLMIHPKTRMKSLINIFSQFDISESYQRTLRMENSLANAVVRRMTATQGNYIPPFIVKDKSVFFAIDNIDFLEDTPTGKGTLHGTAIVMYQQQHIDMEPMVQPLHINTEDCSKATHENKCSVSTLECAAPVLTPPLAHEFITNIHVGLSNVFKLWDLTWVVGWCLGTKGNTLAALEDYGCEKLVKETHTEKGTTTLPTWAAYNSLITDKQSITNVSIIPPLLRTTPTSWPGIYTALKRAQNISVQVVGEDRPTVITLDLQLYEKAHKLMSRPDMKGKYVIRIGELHTVFAAFKSIGRYIEGSGIDQAWIEAGIYSPSTVRQIIEGKHLYRATDAHLVTILTLYDLMFGSVIEKQKQIDDGAQKLNSEFRNVHDNPNLKTAHSTMLSTIEHTDLLGLINEFDRHVTGTASFLRSYMKQFECVLRHIRATRQGLWRLHLDAQENLNKYFMAHDQLNYGRLSPLYCSEMQQLEKSDPATWNALESGDFCVNKADIHFSAIGPDHGIEHENRSMKVAGGIVGLTQCQYTLDRFFLIAPELSRLVKGFEEQNSIRTPVNRTCHHELI